MISTWSPIHLRARLRELYWKPERAAVGALAFWEDTLRYVYLPRLKNRDVFDQAVRSGAASRDFFGIAFAEHGAEYEGFQFGRELVQVDDTLLLIEPDAAKAYEVAQAAKVEPPVIVEPGPDEKGGKKPIIVDPHPEPDPKPPGSFHFTVEINAATAKVKLIELAEEIIAPLCADPNAVVRVTVEISADFPYGAPEQVRRAVSENANNLYRTNGEWE